MKARVTSGSAPLDMLDRVTVEEREAVVDPGDRYDQSLPIEVTPNQRQVIDPAIERCRQIFWALGGKVPGEPLIPEGRALELICADFIACYGANK